MLATPTPGMGGPNDLFDQNGDERNIEIVWQLLHDKDNDPNRGDFGKVDFDDQATSTAARKDAPDGKADNYASTDDARACSNADGDGCDAAVVGRVGSAVCGWRLRMHHEAHPDGQLQMGRRR